MNREDEIKLLSTFVEKNYGLSGDLCLLLVTEILEWVDKLRLPRDPRVERQVGK